MNESGELYSFSVFSAFITWPPGDLFVAKRRNYLNMRNLRDPESMQHKRTQRKLFKRGLLGSFNSLSKVFD